MYVVLTMIAVGAAVGAAAQSVEYSIRSLLVDSAKAA